MTPDSDQSLLRDVAHRLGRRWLSRSLLVMMVINAVLVVCLIGLIFWIGQQCTPINGLTLSGRLFPTDSFTCPDPAVAPLYPRKITEAAPGSPAVAVLAFSADAVAAPR